VHLRRSVWLALGAAILSAACTPADPRPLLERAREAYDAGDFARGASLYEQAIAAGAKGQSPAYNAACCLARAGRTDDAFRMLDEAARSGYREVDWLERDEDLASLRADPRWAAALVAMRQVREAYLGRVNRELVLLYEEDQADRDAEEIEWSVVGPRDEARRKRVYDLIEANALRAADDYYHAAMVLQHGSEPDDFARAHELALRAAELDPDLPSARWLSAAAKDRHLHSLGRPQIYGTQFRRDGNGPWTLDPIDESAVTDEERARWGVPSLAEAKERLRAMNGG